jgi:[ribosomal protein S5]-alanine N-acetyltransferase
MVESFLSVETRRLELIAATPWLIRAEIDDPRRLESLLGRQVPENWPPELVEEARPYFLEDLLLPEAVGWSCWYVALWGNASTRPVVIGTAGFKGWPRSDGTVEIGYSILSQYQGRGYASEAVAGLVRWAFSHPYVSRVIARTLPGAEASMRVLQKNGFRRIEADARVDLVQFEVIPEDLPRPRFRMGVRY